MPGIDLTFINDKKRQSLKPTIKLRVKSLGREIDQMIYQLYGLTEEEIRIVEGKMSEP